MVYTPLHSELKAQIVILEDEHGLTYNIHGEPAGSWTGLITETRSVKAARFQVQALANKRHAVVITGSTFPSHHALLQAVAVLLKTKFAVSMVKINKKLLSGLNAQEHADLAITESGSDASHHTFVSTLAGLTV